MESKPPFPPFTLEIATAKVQIAIHLLNFGSIQAHRGISYKYLFTIRFLGN